ncbi:MAG: tyrosine-type recombinase/integrase [Aestuariivirga sp.]
MTEAKGAAMAGNESRAKLTDRVVNAARPQSERYVIWDTDKSGFGLRVEPSGHKSFIVRYRANGGGRNAPRRQMKVKATPGETLTADAARKVANRILADVAHGKDPQGELASKRGEMTVSKLCEVYLEDGVEAKKASTIAIDKGRIERHIKPLIGSRLLSEINSADVERFLKDVAKGKTAADIKTKKRGRAIVEGGKGTATRTVGLLGGIFSFAVKRKFRADNPVRGVQRYADGKGERFLTAKELGSLGETLRRFEAKGANKSAIAIIRLLTFTGARKSEIAGLRWSEVDFDRSCLRLADSKTGAKVIPLGPPALAILSLVERVDGSPFVFPAEAGGRKFQGTDKIWRKVRAAAKLPDVRLHDLRHSFASAGLLSGDTLPIIGRLLGHADVKTTARYAHLADDPLKAAATRISKTIAAAMDGEPSAQVYQIQKRS